MKKLTVTIGIPAYNEAANIKQLLTSLLAQKQTNFNLKEIIVFTDGCTDDTVKIIKSIKNKLINLHIGDTRIGQQFRQNQILKLYKGNVLVLVEADTLPQDEYTLSELIKPFLKKESNKIGMVVGFDQDVKPKIFFEKVIHNNNKLKQKIFENINGGINVYTTGGHSMRALSRILTKQLDWPKDVPEDAYAYLRTRQLKLKIIRQTNAKVFMKNVEHIKDRTRQTEKYVTGKKYLTKYFKPEFIDSQYFIPKSLIIKCVISQIIKNPLWTSASVVEMCLNNAHNFKSSKTESLLNTYQSSKVLEFH